MSADQITERLKEASCGLQETAEIDLDKRVFDLDIWRKIIGKDAFRKPQKLKPAQARYMFSNLSLNVCGPIRGPALVLYQAGKIAEVSFYEKQFGRLTDVVRFTHGLDFGFVHPLSDGPITVAKTTARAWHAEKLGGQFFESGLAGWNGVFGNIPLDSTPRKYTPLSISGYILADSGNSQKNDHKIFMETCREYVFASGKKVTYITGAENKPPADLKLANSATTLTGVQLPELLCTSDVIYF